MDIFKVAEYTTSPLTCVTYTILKVSQFPYLLFMLTIFTEIAFSRDHYVLVSVTLHFMDNATFMGLFTCTWLEKSVQAFTDHIFGVSLTWGLQTFADP